MANAFTLDDLLPKPDLVPPKAPEGSLTLEDLTPKKEKPEELGPPMPGPYDALKAGLQKSFSDVEQSGEALSGKTPAPDTAEANPAAASFELRDLYEPSRGLSKLSYGVGHSAPTLAAGILGGAAGSLAGPAGTVAGGIGGASAGAALQTIGPAFAQELKKSPRDPEAAWSKAVQGSLASAAASGASWGLFPLKFFNGPIKNLAFQALGVQPAVNVAEQATHNVITGDPITEGLGEAYKQGAVGTAVPALGHLALKGRYGEPDVVNTAPTVAESAAKAKAWKDEASVHRANALQPGIPPDLAKKLNLQADNLDQAADHELDRHLAPARAAAKIQQAETMEANAKAPGTHPLVAAVMKDTAWEYRRSAAQDEFIANLPPPIPQKTGIKGWLQERYIKNIDPAYASEAATKADPIIAEYKSMEAQLRDSLLKHGAETYRYKWNRVAWDDQKRFIYAYEEGHPVPPDLAAKYPWMDQAYKDYRQQFLTDFQNEQRMGSQAHYVENYFPHRWEDVEKAKNIFQPEMMVKSMGPKWFQKARDYDLIQYGEANGLKLREQNVQDMVTGRRLAGADMINRMQMLHELQRNGVAVPLEQAPPHVLNPKLIGDTNRWEPVNAPNGKQWLIAPDAQILWKNGVESKGLYANPNTVGDAFRGWMRVKSFWVPIKLGLSLFHPVHVIHIDAVNNMNRAIGEALGPGQQGLYRRLVSIPEALLQAVTDPFLAGIPKAPFIGKDMMKAWATHPDFQSPQQAANVKLLNEAGISAQMSEQMRMRVEQGFKDALSKNEYLKLLYKGPLRGYEKTWGTIFEKWIPSLKVAALQREAESLLRRRPDLVTNEADRRIALRALGKQIDNRFGEMFYGSLFWNRTLKDASIGSFLSLGWNLGFAREFGGGFFEPIVRRMIDAPNPTRKLIRDVTNKTTNLWMYGLTAALINAAMTKGLSGDNPSGLDYIFPRIGGLNPDGSPRRITNAFYTREIPMAMKNIEERQSVAGGLAQMLYHKMMFAPFIEMATNRNYFGYSITNENDPMYKQMWQFGQHLLGEQISPMSLTGARRALDLSGKPHDTASVFKQLTDRDVYLPLMGFGPAPAYASKDEWDNRIQYLFKKYVAPEAKSFDVSARSKERYEARMGYLGAKQRNDQADIQKYAQKMASLGMTNAQINKIKPGGSTEYMFQRLPAEDQKAMLKEMPPEIFRKYYKNAQKKLRQGDEELATLARRYSQQQP